MHLKKSHNEGSPVHEAPCLALALLTESPEIATDKITYRRATLAPALHALYAHACWYAIRAGCVCVENLIRFDCVTESHNVGDDGCAPMLLSGAVGLAVRVEEPA